MDEQREKFEAWAAGPDIGLDTRSDEFHPPSYRDYTTEWAWSAWQAALSQPAAQSYEHQRAIMEGHRNEAAEIWQNEMDYTDGELRAFDQGFTSGWDRAKATP